MNHEARTTILLVTAGPEDRSVYRQYLEDAYHVLEAEHGAQALALCQESQPACLLLDFRLPDGEGLTWLRRVQAQHGSLAPAVMILAEADHTALAVEAMQQGAADYLLKQQLTPERLRAAVHRAVESAALRHSLAAYRQQLQENERRLRARLRALEQRVQECTAALAEAQAERQRVQQEAEQAAHFALLGRLAAGVSHELRNPLGALFLNVDLLAEELAQPSADSPRAVADALAEIQANLVRVDELVENYLSLGRVGTLERTVQDLGASLVVWATEFQALATARGMLCVTDGLATLGPVAFHANTLRRAVLNLVQNALDAMAPGSTLTLRGHATPDQVRLVVEDTGSGITPERLRQIFEPLHTTKPHGTGLGLYIVQEIVAAHGGRVAVESVVGQGTTFTLTLPRTASTPPEPRAGGSAAQG